MLDGEADKADNKLLNSGACYPPPGMATYRFPGERQVVPISNQQVVQRQILMLDHFAGKPRKTCKARKTHKTRKACKACKTRTGRSGRMVLAPPNLFNFRYGRSVGPAQQPPRRCSGITNYGRFCRFGTGAPP